MKESRAKVGLDMPTLIGIGLSCQLVDEVPVDEYDFVLDEIVSNA